MGEVYKAKDQKLGRDVAIKVLPEEFAKDADRVARFQREAKLLASLNHPNIAAIHGLEESDGTHFLVLELIEGDTLADRLKHGAIPAEESLKLALQITEALEAAHEKGVIHRDLKPANIKITPEGKVKVLDFGLAKAFAGDERDMNLSNSPTLSAAATQQGIILGTAAYMSPEQARGEPVYKKADIWAFGCVLFEMLTGRKTATRLTFDDADDSDPIWTPDGDRIAFASNREGAVSVYWNAADGTGVAEQLGSVSGNMIIPSSWSGDGKALVLEAVSAGRAAGVNVMVMEMEGDRATSPLLQGEYIEANPQVSPDGRWLAYFSQESGQSEVFVRPFPDVNSGKWQISSNFGQEPRWSPDGRELYYRSNDSMMVVSVETEPTFRAGLSEELFRDTYFAPGPGHSWDITTDGSRFLMIKSVASINEDSTTEAPQPKINIVLNWFEELKERVPLD